MPTEKELMLKQADAETTYQKKLTAGTNITIDPVTNVISSAGGGSTVQYTDNVPNGESVGILAINGQSHPIRIPRLAEGSGITITKDISTNVYTISSTGGGSGTTKSYMGETDPDELVGEDGDLYFKYHKIETDIPTELTLPSLPDDATVPFSITNFSSYESFTFYYTDLNRESHSRTVNTGDLVISDSPADEYPNSNIYSGNSYCFVQATRSVDGEGLVLRVSGNCLYKLEANVTEVDLGIDKSYAKVEDTWLPSGEQVEANPEETSETPLTRIKIDGVTYYIAAGGSAEIVPLTKAEWDALPASKYTDNILYLITDSFTTETIITPNPEGEATDTLTKLQIDETIYSLAGGSGGGGEGYTETVLWTGSESTDKWVEPIVLNDINIDEYDALAIQVNVSQHIVSTEQIPIGDASASSIIGVNGFLNTNGENVVGIWLNKGNNLLRIFTATNVTIVLTKVVGIKYGSGGGSEPANLKPFVFDETEYKVGEWTDGKTIYQKTIELSSPITIADTPSEISWGSDITNIENIIGAVVHRRNEDTAYGSATSAVMARKSNGKILLYNGVSFSDAKYITLQYTRTVDNDSPWHTINAGGGGGTSEGEGVEIYSENEYIVGKWIDGKNVYQKTYTGLSVQTSGTSWTHISAIDTSDWGEVIDCEIYRTMSEKYAKIPLAEVSTNANGITDLAVTLVSSTFDSVITAVTVRYTKTVETPAPAWGGSVTNNYANFIDTDNVIVPSTTWTGSMSYTATEDCYIILENDVQNGHFKVTIDGVEVYDCGTSGQYVSIKQPFAIKKGQILGATSNQSNTLHYTVYGISYGSGGSSSESSMHYSTTEQVIGTWIDGKPLYQKTYENLNIGTVQNYTLTLSDLQNIEYFRVVPEGSQVSATVPFPYIHYGTQNIIGYFTDITNGVPSLEIRKGSEATSFSNLQFLTIQYTKTTD